MSTSVGGGYGGFSAHAGFSIKNLNENIDQNTNLEKKRTKITIGNRDVPLPVHLHLELITKSLDKIWWGDESDWRKNGIDKKQQNLLKALKGYPRYVGAKKNTGKLRPSSPLVVAH